MKVFVSIVCACSMALVLSGCVSDGDEVPASGNQVAQVDSDRVCRTESPTGSRIKKKRCWSRADYDAMVKASEEEMRRMNTSRTVSSGGEN